MKQKPLLLGHHSEKVKELWAQVKNKEEFKRVRRITSSQISAICSGKHKYLNSKYYYVLNTILNQLKVEQPLCCPKPPQYEFLKPVQYQN
jgi:hypothetical protein